MTELKTTLKEAIAKAISDEMRIADQLAHAVLERHHNGSDRSSTWADQITHQETALLAKQRTVDTLKLALSRLPEAQQTY
jgi:siroheme synthase (precorrin-2 oxidase/ferrochelatase)